MQWFNNLKVRTKLLASSMMILAVLIAGLVVVAANSQKMAGKSTSIIKEQYVGSVNVALVEADIASVRAALVSMMNAADRSVQEKQHEAIRKESEKLDQRLAMLAGISDFPDDMRLPIQEMYATWQAFRDTRDKELIPAFFAGDMGTTRSLANGIQAERYQKMMTLTKKFLDQEARESEQVIATIHSDVNRNKVTVIILIVLSLAVGVGLAVYLSKNIGQPVEKVSQVVKKMAAGDLTENNLSHESRDELGEMIQSFQEMSGNLRTAVHRISDISATLASAAEELSATAEEVTEGAKKQSNEAIQVAAAMEEMNATVADVAKNCQSASVLAEDARTTVDRGRKVVEQTISGIKQVAENVTGTAQMIRVLGKRSEEIGTIVAVINEIADQTNLLALNAAIEAARAGEQGRGFAVVADEVRKLADRTTKATQEIGGMIKAIQAETARTVQSMEDGTRRVEEGGRLANETDVVLHEIVSSIEQVSDMIKRIAAAAEEQSASASEISNNTENIANIARTNSAAMSQVSGATQDLAKLTSDLQGISGQFKIA